jgi:hypothetical protein
MESTQEKEQEKDVIKAQHKDTTIKSPSWH